jgi:hypothetical protein
MAEPTEIPPELRLVSSAEPALPPSNTAPPLPPSAARKDRLKKTGSDEKELLPVVVENFLVAEINRLTEENQQLKQFKERYHDVDKKLAVLKETLKPLRANELLTSACLAAGSFGLGAAPSILSVSTYGWYLFVIVSTLLVLAGIRGRVLMGPSSGTTTPRH